MQYDYIKRFIFSFLIGFLQLPFLYSQKPPFYHYTTENGLPSATAYEMIQDRSGFIWFATANGISRFDGKNFKNYGTNDGLNSNSIRTIMEGRDGEIFVATYEDGINIYNNGKISEFKGPGTYNFVVHGVFLTENRFYGYSDNIYAFSSNKLSSDLRILYFKKPIDIGYQALINQVQRLSDGTLLVLTTNGLFKFENNNFIKLNIAGFPDANIYCMSEDREGNIFIGCAGKIYQLKNYKLVKEITSNLLDKDKITRILVDKQGSLWFSILNKSFFRISKGTEQIVDIGKILKLNNAVVNCFFEDNESNIWVSLYGKGVYCLNNLYLSNYTEEDGLSNNNVQAIAMDNSGRLIFGTFNGINILDDGKIKIIKSNIETNLTDYIYEIKIYNNEVYVCGSYDINLNIVRRKAFNLEFVMLNSASFCITKDGYYIRGTWREIIRQKELKNYLKLYIDKPAANVIPLVTGKEKNNRVNKIIEDSDNNLWIGTTFGLYKIKDWAKEYFGRNEILSSKVRSIIQDKQNNIWFAGEKGIARYNLENDSVSAYTNFRGYDLSSSIALALDNKNRLWMANRKGLYLFDGQSIKHLNTNSGLSSNEALSLYYDSTKNFLYLGTSMGLSLLDVSLFDKYNFIPPGVLITNIKAGDSVYQISNNLIFEPDQNDISLEFIGINYSSPGSVIYRYKLNGKWVETNHNFLNFSSLQGGKYKLQIMAKSQNTGWGNPRLLTFEIKPHFSETKWFIAGILSLVIFISVSVVVMQINRHNKRVKDNLLQAERINDLKHQALSAMMNPHFIFNSLNSVQYLVSCNRVEEANEYIAMMARLFRKNLETAGQGFILLSEEIDRLKLYLDIEKLRFRDGFSYEIVICPDVNTSLLMIPNMIIQPFVENTLWHGIINSGNYGIVNVTFSFEDVEVNSNISKSLVIKISDNGIGINAARKNKREDHISKGIQIIEERLKLLSTEMNVPQPIMIEDLSSRNENSHGTEVIISLPSPLYKFITPV